MSRPEGIAPEKIVLYRRRLLHFVLQSPLLTGAAMWPMASWPLPERAIPDEARRALDLFQIKAAAREKLDLAAWHFIVNGADDGKTMAANRAAFDDWQIRVRRLVDVSAVDLTVELFGQSLQSPILLAPIGGQQLIHPSGEIGTARGAGTHVMICSTVSNAAFPDIASAAPGPVWFQLYASRHRAFMKFLLEQAEQAGSPVVVLTVDGPTIGNRLGERWFRHLRSSTDGPLPMGNFDRYDGKKNIGDPSMTWEIVDWLRANTNMKIVLKGIVTREDARLCKRYGVDGVVVSNHGGRQEESGRGTLHCLTEVIDGADGRMPVLIDGGFRRGTDIFKALALGASGVCIGRPQVWGLGAFGEEGVKRVMALLRSELVRIMKFAGTTRIDQIGPGYLQRST